MFTGLVEEVGAIRSVQPLSQGRRLVIECQKVLEGLQIGDSIALNGVCQTVVAFDRHQASFEAVGDTLTKTTLGRLEVGAALNLERACRADGRLGGHFVLGHVQSVTTVTHWEPRGDGWTLELALPQALVPYLVAEGSVAVDGVSLTVAEVDPHRFRISIIPHTVSATNLVNLKVGSLVNLETDILARYVEAQLRAARPGLASDALKLWGYQ